VQVQALCKVKVNLSLYLIKHHAIKMYGGVETAPVFLASAWIEVRHQLPAPATLPPGKEPLVPNEQEVGLDPGTSMDSTE
jgi:hypothetical protein